MSHAASYGGGSATTQADRSLPVLVIGGPTASGKSGLALFLAKRLNGVIVNADSMQLYAVLNILTARPDAQAMAQATHRLYGIIPPSQQMSVALWRDLAMAEITAIHAQGQVPIVVGGTGLYLRALMQGLATIPPIPETVRQQALAKLAAAGPQALHTDLVQRDPRTAARLAPGDSQRLVRAWEVLQATGRSLTDWQQDPVVGPPPHWRWISMVTKPPRPALYAACDARLCQMLDRGALAEVSALRAMALDPALPAMKALGVPEFMAHLNGSLPLDQALRQAQQATRNYAKRQCTWFRHQMPQSLEITWPEPAPSHHLYDDVLRRIGEILTGPTD